MEGSRPQVGEREKQVQMVSAELVSPQEYLHGYHINYSSSIMMALQLFLKRLLMFHSLQYLGEMAPNFGYISEIHI